MRVQVVALLSLLSLAAAPAHAVVSAENDWYVVLADPARHGAYAVGTGVEHAVTLNEGERSNILRGGGPGFSGVSFNSLRSYASGTDYRFGHAQFILVDDPDFECVLGNAAAPPVITPVLRDGREVGLSFAWDIDRGPDRLLVEQRLVARGELGPLNTCFAYSIFEPPRQAFGGPATAGVYFWGDTPETARVLAPGETFSVTQYAFAYLQFPLSCDAGPAPVAECAGPVTAVPLDGSASENREGEGVQHLWTSASPQVEFEDPTLERPVALVSGLGRHEVELLAHRGPHATSCATSVEVVDTTPPELLAPPPLVLQTSDHGREACALPARLVAEAWDRCAGGYVAITHVTEPFIGSGGAEAAHDFPPGTTRITFRAVDPSGNVAEAETTVTVIDDIPPWFVELDVEPSVLWPPNHRMVEVQVRAQAVDNCDPAPAMRLVEVVSSEPDDARGDGSTRGDVQEVEPGTADFALLLRAERDGRGPGRTYSIRYVAEDEHGNRTEGEAHVLVPHDQAGRP